MNNEELKKKIVDIALHAEWMDMFGDHNSIGKYAANAIADALIAAGIGDLKEHRIFAGKDGSIKQLYSGEEVEKIVKERKELKDELRSKVEYIHEQDEVVKEYKHRAKVAERAVENLSYKRAKILLYDDSKTAMEKIKQAELRQAEKELAEEGKE